MSIERCDIHNYRYDTDIRLQCPRCEESEVTGESFTRLELFETLPLAQRTLERRMTAGSLPVPFEYGELPGEYCFTMPDGSRGMVKYYQGRKLACYELVPYDEAHP